MTKRSVKEWIGRTPDSKVPPRVRLRIFQRENGICHISKRKIQPGEKWELDHVPALINGGQNRESMLFPVLKDKHRQKTNDDVAEKASVAAKAKKHIGADKPHSKLAAGPKEPKRDAEKALAAIGPTAMQRRYGVAR